MKNLNEVVLRSTYNLYLELNKRKSSPNFHLKIIRKIIFFSLKNFSLLHRHVKIISLCLPVGSHVGCFSGQFFHIFEVYFVLAFLLLYLT